MSKPDVTIRETTAAAGFTPINPLDQGWAGVWELVQMREQDGIVVATWKWVGDGPDWREPREWGL